MWILLTSNNQTIQLQSFNFGDHKHNKFEYKLVLRTYLSYVVT